MPWYENCENTDYGVFDDYGDNCVNYYDINAANCPMVCSGTWDTASFQKDMCCVCGGGKVPGDDSDDATTENGVDYHYGLVMADMESCMEFGKVASTIMQSKAVDDGMIKLDEVKELLTELSDMEAQGIEAI